MSNPLLTFHFPAIPQQTWMKQCSRTLLRSPYRVQNLPLTAQGKTALWEHQISHFCPTEAQLKGFVTLCDQLWLYLTFQAPWHCSSCWINFLIIPQPLPSVALLQKLISRSKVQWIQVVLPFCLSHTESLWLSLLHIIHPLLALLISIIPLTNHLPMILQIMLIMLLINSWLMPLWFICIMSSHMLI